MSIKIDRIGSNLVKEISYILMTEIKDPNVKFVTVTDCRVTSDLSFAKVYVTCLKDEKRDETLKALKNASSYIRRLLHDRVDLRHIPQLTFLYDESIEYGKKIEEIIDEINNW